MMKSEDIGRNSKLAERDQSKRSTRSVNCGFGHGDSDVLLLRSLVASYLIKGAESFDRVVSFVVLAIYSIRRIFQCVPFRHHSLFFLY